ncbi:hypothetical protein ABTH88_23010, partial [Acinetobacter baumannii]
AQTEAGAEGKQAVRRITISVDPGPRTEISSAEVSVTGAVARDDQATVARLREDWSLPVGQPFRQEDWNRAKNAGLEKL